MNKTEIDEFVSTDEGMRTFQQERAIESVTGLICKLMQRRGVKRKDLANRLGVSSGWITQLLDGEKNKSVRTLSDVFHALGYALYFVAGPEDIRFVVKDIYDSPMASKEIAFAVNASEIAISTTEAQPARGWAPNRMKSAIRNVFGASQHTPC